MRGRLLEGKFWAYLKKTAVMLELDGHFDTDKWSKCELDVEIKKHREKRSLNANAYFHVLADKLADKRNISKTHQKNDLLTSYGQRLYLKNGDRTIIKTNIPPEDMQELAEPHCKFIKYSTDENDIAFYEVWRGSHTFDSNEMSKLIEGAVAEAQGEGIDTMTPDEIARLTAIWKPTE